MQTHARKILLIEDNPVEIVVMHALLAKAQKEQAFSQDTYQLESATTLAEGLRRLNEEQFDLILLDLSLPDSDRLDTLATVRSQGQQTPVVVLTWLGDEQAAVEALQLGAQDYLLKGQSDPQVVMRAIRYAIERHRLLQNQSLFDDLTGLLNLRGFRNVAEHNCKLARRSGSDLLVLYADLDDLKPVNDYLGHAAGSALICQAADILRETFRASDIIARVGGDEFLVLLIDVVDRTEELVRQRLQEKIDEHNARSLGPVSVSMSIGVARFEASRELSLSEVIAQADEAMYQDKRAKKEARLKIKQVPPVPADRSMISFTPSEQVSTPKA
jgi:two-component system, cell cycle response regulator